MSDDLRSAHEVRRGLRPAPGDLALVQAFANSVGGSRDELESPRALADWLGLRTLLATGAELTEADLERARRVRDGLRAVIAARRGAAPQEVREALEQELWPATMRARFPAAGGLRLDPAASALDGVFGRLLVILAAAHYRGELTRLGMCAVESCRTVFYDRSTNRRGLFCRIRCGNRVHAIHHRRREKRRKESN